jgi:putative transposase
VQSDDRHFLLVCRYVERNPLKANLVGRAENWRWSSLHRRLAARSAPASASIKSAALANQSPPPQIHLSDWPVPEPRDWVERVNQPLTPREQRAMTLSLTRSRPFGSEPWTAATVKHLKLQWTVRPRGRPEKKIAKKDSRPL